MKASFHPISLRPEMGLGKKTAGGFGNNSIERNLADCSESRLAGSLRYFCTSITRSSLNAAIHVKAFAPWLKICLTRMNVHVYSTPIEASTDLNGRRLAAEPRFLPSVIGQKHAW